MLSTKLRSYPKLGAVTDPLLHIRGEKTAATMEHQLTHLERKLDDLLASAEEQADDSAAHMLSGNQKVVGEEVPS